MLYTSILWHNFRNRVLLTFVFSSPKRRKHHLIRPDRDSSIAMTCSSIKFLSIMTGPTADGLWFLCLEEISVTSTEPCYTLKSI